MFNIKIVGFALSDCTQDNLVFVVKESEKVLVNNYYFVMHPVKRNIPVLASVYKLEVYNPEMLRGRPGPLAGKKGREARYGKKIEYGIAYAEVLGYYDEGRKWRRLECALSPWDQVYEPSEEELRGFFTPKGASAESMLVEVGHVRGCPKLPVLLDLNMLAKSHMFVAGMTRSGKSSFVLNLILKAMKMKPSPRFIIFDRRGEYGVLKKYGAESFSYTDFLPPETDAKRICERLGVRRGTKECELIERAVGELIKSGTPVSTASLMNVASEFAQEVIKGRSKEEAVRRIGEVLSDLRWRLKERGRFLDRGARPLDVVEIVKESSVIIIDFSIDTDIDEQQATARDIIKQVVEYAIERRSIGDFAAVFVAEEAQYLAPEKGLRLELGRASEIGVDKAFIEAVSQAGGYNVGFIVMTQRPAYVSKCLPGDTPIYMADGSLTTIKEFYEQVKKEGSVLRRRDEEVAYPKKLVKLLSMDEGLKCSTTEVQCIARRVGAQKILSIETMEGYKVECTPDHRLFTLRPDGDVAEIMAKDLCINTPLILLDVHIPFHALRMKHESKSKPTCLLPEKNRGGFEWIPLSPRVLKKAVVEVYGEYSYHDLWHEVVAGKRQLTRHSLKSVLRLLEKDGRKADSPSLNILKKIAESNAHFPIVRKIEEGEVEETFDIQTTANRFIGGQAPFLIHNSVISQCNTVACFRLKSGNDQDAIIQYTEYGGPYLKEYLPGLADHETMIWGLAIPTPFPIIAEIDVAEFPQKAVAPAKRAWQMMEEASSKR